MTTIKTFTGQDATFYIQSKGLHSGRPMKTPKSNCFAVTTSIENSFEIVFALYKGNAFKEWIKGSVIPFISITDLKKIVLPKIKNSKQLDSKKLNAICSIDLHVENLNSQIKKYKELQVALAFQAISEK